MNVDTVSIIGQALADPTRVRLFEILDGKTSVGEAAALLNVTSPTASYHLRLLKQAGLVEVRRRGRRSVPRRLPDGLRVLARALG